MGRRVHIEKGIIAGGVWCAVYCRETPGSDARVHFGVAQPWFALQLCHPLHAGLSHLSSGDTRTWFQAAWNEGACPPPHESVTVATPGTALVLALAVDLPGLGLPLQPERAAGAVCALSCDYKAPLLFRAEVEHFPAVGICSAEGGRLLGPSWLI